MTDGVLGGDRIACNPRNSRPPRELSLASATGHGTDHGSNWHIPPVAHSRLVRPTPKPHAESVRGPNLASRTAYRWPIASNRRVCLCRQGPWRAVFYGRVPRPFYPSIYAHATSLAAGRRALASRVEKGKELMSHQTEVLRKLVALFNGGKTIDVTRFFTEDFRLEDPGAGVIRTGLDGAQRMMEAVRALAHDGRLEILDTFESGNRVAVRWSYKGQHVSFAMMSIYEFAGDRIHRDWGILARAPWTD